MGDLALGSIMGISFLVSVSAGILLFFAPPLYLSGKITGIRHEKFTYLYCVYIGFVTTFVGWLLTGVFGAIFGMTLKDSESIMQASIPSFFIASVLVIWFFLAKKYLLGNIQIVKTYALFLIFFLLFFLAVMYVMSLIMEVSMSSLFGIRANKPAPSEITGDAYSSSSYETTSNVSADHLSTGKNVSISDSSEFRSKLQKSIVNGDEEKFNTLLKDAHNLNIYLRYGSTYLVEAVMYKRVNMVEALVEAGADVNFKDSDGSTPLATAVILGETDDGSSLKEIAKYLIENGANPTVKDNDGATIFDYANDEWKKYLKTLGIEEFPTI